MDLNRLTRDADDLIRKVVSRYNQLYVPAGQISQVDLDLMLDDMRKLYDTFKTIGQINLTLQGTTNKPEVSVSNDFRAEPQPKAETTPPPAPAENVSSARQQEPAPAPKPEPEPVYTPEPQAQTVETAISKTEPEIKEETKFEEPIEKPVESKPVFTESAVPESPVAQKNTDDTQTVASHSTFAEKYTTGNKSLSETLASAQLQGAGPRVLFQPITDLTTAIGLNDKFSFISELFANNAIQYEEAITRINKAVNLDEANWILQKYHTPDWDQKQETLLRIKEFIKRRFV
jgi:hypothetical protein